MDDAGRQRRPQSGLVHMRDHQHVAARRIDRDAGREAVGAEFRLERAALLPVACGAGTMFGLALSFIPGLSPGARRATSAVLS